MDRAPQDVTLSAVRTRARKTWVRRRRVPQSRETEGLWVKRTERQFRNQDVPRAPRDTSADQAGCYLS